MTELKIKQRTTSIWSFINSNKDMYVSCLRGGLGDSVEFFKTQIIPDTSFVNLRFWKEYFSFCSISAFDKPQFNNVEMNTKT